MKRIGSALLRNLYDILFFCGGAVASIGAVWSWFRSTPFQVAILGIALMWVTVERRHARRDARDWASTAHKIGELHHHPLGYPVGHSVINGPAVTKE